MVSRDSAVHEEVLGFEPSVWGDFFINYEPQPLQALPHCYFPYMHCPCILINAMLTNCSDESILNFKQRSETCMQERAEKLKGDIRTLFGTYNDISARMNLVDSIQHLGIVHLFQEQIEDALMSIHESEFTSSSLYEVALRFRLLREHGFWVPPGTNMEQINLC